MNGHLILVFAKQGFKTFKKTYVSNVMKIVQSVEEKIMINA